MITLSDGTTTLILPADLLWTDEFDWSPVVQTVNPSVTGALIIQSSELLAGREFTLQPEDDSSAAMTRDTLTQLEVWSKAAGKQLVLTLRGIAYNVIWRHHDKPALSSKPWIHYSDMDSGDYYFVAMKFMGV